MKKALHSLLFVLIAYYSYSQSSTCNLGNIQSAMAAKGYKPLNVLGQPCSVYFYRDSFGPETMFDSAQSIAQSMGGNIVVFNDSMESVNVLNAIIADSIPLNGWGVWVGVKRLVVAGQQFYAIDNSSSSFLPGSIVPNLYQNWSLGEPNNSGYHSGSCWLMGSCICGNSYLVCDSGEQCVQSYISGGWNDISCYHQTMVPVIEINTCPQVTASNDTVVCANSAVTLSAIAQHGTKPYSFVWTPGSLNGSTIIDTAANTTVNIVTLTDRWGCTAMDTQTTTVQTVSVIGAHSICAGDSLPLSVLDTGLLSYVWNTGETTATIMAKQAGEYTVTVVSNQGCTITATDTVAVIPAVVPYISISVDDSFVCQGEGLTFTANYNNGGSSPVLDWKVNGVSTRFSGSNYYTDSLVDSDLVSVQLISNATCAIPATIQSSNVLIMVQPKPATPSISLSGSTLVSSSIAGNQWYLNGVKINGANSQNYIPTQNGNYTVDVTTVFDCSSSMSSTFVYRVAGMNVEEEEQVTLYPNPATDLLRITSAISHVDKLRILDVQGKVLAAYEHPSTTTIAIDSIQQGIYFAEVTIAGKVMRVKWTKL